MQDRVIHIGPLTFIMPTTQAELVAEETGVGPFGRRSSPRGDRCPIEISLTP